MDKKKQIINILLDELNSVYCYNCQHYDTREDMCEECHRKYMNWSLSTTVAEALAERIIRLDNK